jgi:hypothetical protein
MSKRGKRLRTSLTGGIGELHHTSLQLLWITDNYFNSSHIFPSYSSAKQPIAKNSALAKIKERRAQTKVVAVSAPASHVSTG